MSSQFKSNPSKTLFTIATACLLLFWYQSYTTIWLLYIAIGLGVIAISSDYLSTLIEKLWFGIAKIMGLIMPKIILSVVFFCFLWPIAQLSKLFRKTDPLMIKNSSSSTFIDSKTVFDKQYFENMW